MIDLLRKILKSPILSIKYFLYYLFGNTVGRIAYSSKYLVGKHFQKIHSSGWKWVYHSFIWQKIFGINRHVPWPTSRNILIVSPQNIFFHPDDLNNFQTIGNYFQACEKIEIGKGTYIAPNVGLITQNHNLKELDKRGVAKEIIIGEQCWIGMNSMILPGIVLGKNTIVGAGSVVTKSFSEGGCVIAGNPAKIIKRIM
ncbi:acyltransferase [Bacteroides sp. 519]|uniref:acyltransferase n=1 Tax=Bacteroides sp. 519 TaxID=2302937 RepID=UPI0013D82C4A|nr:acyltransferase [Bacteroides sp. 519]NDV58982.1 acyltransferase [Bacteroides sp. 519]